ncbi:Membrane associated, signal transduction histidine kinase-like ATPase [Acidisarcina polymorpha]|uniref:Membrane associated, signal transduction histidine kinase-like ATPase n=1 Tax=Acidisarcina polymorpha TaxID=2211140 RepID=A0A2Z5FZS8_9BACT|nr:sensor histidine kinase [Acidisarcina polymorpha]AXC11905.1 Membrane associated, signal transduction histidine kinase-like ATPase [Acidisarcina polymorpha]
MNNLRIPLLIPAMCFWFCCFVSSVWAVDPGRHISQYGHTAWRVQDGFLNAGVYTITQTVDGYMWIGTQNGLVRFDGVRFVPWVLPAGQHLPSSIITSLLGARDGSLWIGTTSGLSHWVNHNLMNVDLPGVVTQILEDRNGTIWFNSRGDGALHGPLCQIVATGFRCYGKAEGIPAYASVLAEDSQGNLWIGGASEVVRWTAESHSVYTTRGLRSSEGQSGVTSLVASPDGSIWAGMSFAGPDPKLQQLVRGAWKAFQAPRFEGATLPISALFLDRQGSLWIGVYSQGIYRVHGENVDHFRSADGLSDDFVQHFYEDREGNLWVGSDKGIDLFHDVPVATFAPHQALDVSEVDSVLTSRDGTVWVGSDSALEGLHGDQVSLIRTGKGLPGNQVTSLFEDHAGRLWVGIDETLSICTNGKFFQIRRDGGGPVGWVYAIAEDADRNIWAETLNKGTKSLLRIRNFRVVEELPAPQTPAARSIAPDPQGGIWLGLLNGDLARVRRGRTETFHFEHKQDSRVEQVTANPDGSVLGATEFGLIGWKEGKRQNLATNNGLPCDWVHAFVPDDHGALWLYMQCGLVEISGAEMEKWWKQPDGPVQVRVFDVFDGVRPGRSSPFAAAGRSADGRMWFGHGAVLQVIDPAHLASNPFPPPVHVEELVADRKAYSPIDGLQIPALTRELEIDYTALSFVVPQKVRFRYKLEGHDAEWQEPGTRRQAFYNDLAPGRYRFRVIACNNDGIWNEDGATLNLSVAPAWFQTNWVRALCVAFVLCTTWVFYRLRTRQIASAISARFDERLSERTRMARELHDTFLQTIQGSKFVVDDGLEDPLDAVKMHHALGQVSAWLEQAIEEGRAALNSLRSSTILKNDLGPALKRAAESGVVPDGMTISVSVIGDARELHPIVRDELYRIGREAIQNAKAHSHGSSLEIDLTYGQDLALHIRDNGVGIDPDYAMNGREGHFGLRGMRERAARIGARLTILNSAESGTDILVVVAGNVSFTHPDTGMFSRLRSLYRRAARHRDPS